jgi:predicted outer membrane lipoprotein
MKGLIRLVIALVACAFGVLAALAELVSEGAFSQEKALELARMHLHDNAAKLYGAKP